MKTGMESVLAFLAGLGAAAIGASAAEVREIVFENGEMVEGIVVPASECPVVVQTEEWCLEVPVDRIRTVDGRDDVVAALRGDAPPLLRTETFEELLPNGDLLLRTSFERAHRGGTTTHEIDWGIAPHEKDRTPHWKVFDEFGHELALRFEDRADGGQRAFARLRRPWLPGEVMRFSTERLFPEYVRRDGNELVYRHRGDYPEDRFVSKMVLLPEGAEVVRVTPDSAHRFDVAERSYVLWRHYFKAGEVTPVELAYRIAK